MAKRVKVNYPYFNHILSELEHGNTSIEKGFGHHVHWGHWEYPDEATCDDDDFFKAAENLSRKLFALAEITDNQRILDAGCGFGGTTSLLNDCYDGMKLTGINIDTRQIKRAKQIVIASKNNVIDFVEGNACILPFADAQFDRVLAVECIFHFPSREAFFQEVCRVLKPGGILTLSDFVSSTLLYPSCKIGSLPIFGKLNFFGFCNFITINKYRQLATKFGLKMRVVDITENTIPTYRYLKLMLKKSKLNTFYAMQAAQVIFAMKWMAKLRLMTYPLISFTKSE